MIVSIKHQDQNKTIEQHQPTTKFQDQHWIAPGSRRLETKTKT